MSIERKHIHTLIAATLLGTGAATFSGSAIANDSSELEALRALVQELDQKIRVLDRKSELAEEKAATEKKAAPKIVAGDKGFGIESADGQHKLRLSGLLHVDHRWAIDDDDLQSNDGYLLRRVRPTFSGTLFGKYDFRFTPDFAPAAANVQDAFINARFKPWFAVQAGKFKTPVSLERLQGGDALRFTERAYVANALTPNRDIGVQVHGNLFDDKLSYAFGNFNGVQDGGSSSNSDNNVDREWAARIFAHPFKGQDNLLSGLGIGIAGTTSDYGSALLNHQYKSPGQNTFFSYAAGVNGDGRQNRIVPQFYYYAGPFGLIGEYARVTHDVERGAHSDKLSHKAWQLAGTYVLTGEDNSFRSITPKNNFDLDKGTWGAWEIGLRYTELDIDDKAFEGAAGVRYAGAPGVNGLNTTEKAKSWAASLNWYLNKNVKLQTTYEHTNFDSAIAGLDDREDEKVLFTRFQVAY
jgi:phosphate-selective porin OprO/OprP